MNADLNLVGIISVGIGVVLYVLHPYTRKHASARTRFGSFVGTPAFIFMALGIVLMAFAAVM